MEKIKNTNMETEPARLIMGTAIIICIILGMVAKLAPWLTLEASGIIAAAVMAIAAELTRSRVSSPATVAILTDGMEPGAAETKAQASE